MDNERIDILLATYNGADYLSDQLDSIIKQSYENWKIIIRDDGSEDETLNIARRYAQIHSDKIIVIEDEKRNLGVCLNFSELLKQANSDYVMFCDQDDIWLTDKIKITLQKMKEMESKYGPECPIIVHTDLVVVDQHLNQIAESFWKLSHLDPAHQNQFSKLLIQNFVTGCTVMINRPLKKLSPNIPQKAMCHDWWLALTASVFGIIASIPKPSILYRQHMENALGVKKWNHVNFLKNLIEALIQKKISGIYQEEKLQTQNVLQRIVQQSKCFHDYYYEKLNEQQRQLSSFLGNLNSYNFFERRIRLLRGGIYVRGLARNLRLFIYT